MPFSPSYALLCGSVRFCCTHTLAKGGKQVQDLPASPPATYFP